MTTYQCLRFLACHWGQEPTTVDCHFKWSSKSQHICLFQGLTKVPWACADDFTHEFLTTVTEGVVVIWLSFAVT